MSEFRENIFRAVVMIPEGRVGSYAQVAELAGFAGAARAVGNALHLISVSPGLPSAVLSSYAFDSSALR